MKVTKTDVREEVISLIGEASWQYACYNYNIDELIENSESVHEIAEIIQDLIARDLLNTKSPDSMNG